VVDCSQGPVGEQVRESSRASPVVGAWSCASWVVRSGGRGSLPPLVTMPMANDLMPSDPGEFLFYQTEDGHTRLHVRMEGETVWLSQK